MNRNTKAVGANMQFAAPVLKAPSPSRFTACLISRLINGFAGKRVEKCRPPVPVQLESVAGGQARSDCPSQEGVWVYVILKRPKAHHSKEANVPELGWSSHCDIQ